MSIMRGSRTAFPEHNCPHCNLYAWGVVEVIFSNGASHYRCGCMECDSEVVAWPDRVQEALPGMSDCRVGDRYDLTKEFALSVGISKWVEPAAVPQALADAFPGLTCNVCGDPFVELHHYAPKEFFGVAEANAFGTVPLCKKHHDRWHQVINDFMKRVR